MTNLRNVRFFLTLFCVLAFGIAFGQTRNVHGTVKDEMDEYPIFGASILVKGSSTGTITGNDGSFNVQATEGDVLVVSFVGYVTKEVTVPEDGDLDILLEMFVIGVDEVLVIGYGEQKKEDATGAILSINQDLFNPGVLTSPQDLLAGKAAGVQISTTGGEPGSAATIRIRGGASLSASNDPLYIIDGVPVDNDGVSGMRNPLNTINPNDIESFTVLKDASATAIYGSRASNGVIIITTKKGAEEGVRIEYNGMASVGIRTRELETFSASELTNLVSQRYGADSQAAGLLGTANTNWQDEIFTTAFGQDHNVSVSGKTTHMPYRVSVGYNNQEGILKTSGLERVSGSASLSPSFFENHLKLEANVKGMQIKNRFVNYGAINSALIFDPTQPVMDANSAYGGYFTWMNGDIPSSVSPSNPVALIDQTEDKSTVMRSIGNLKLDYKFHFAPKLVATLNLGYDYSDTDGSVLITDDAAFAHRTASDGTDISGEDRVYTQKKENQLLDFYLNYNTKLPGIKSELDVMGGYSWQHFYRNDYVKATSVNGEYLIEPEQNFPTENYLVSFFGRLNYTLKGRYMLTATVRQDGTSRFSEENRWGLFPSAALAWKINEESFLKDAKNVSTLKLRASYGITGQQYITSDNYPYQGKYSLSQSTARYLIGDTWVTMARPDAYDSDLKWEETTTYNVGLDYGFFNNRINGAFEVYYRQTDDLINTIPVAAGTNFSNMLLTNIGSMENKGVELTLNLRPVQKENVLWEIGFNVSHNTNTITKLTNVDSPDYKGVATGVINSSSGGYAQINSVGEAANSFYMYQQVYDENNMPVEGLYVDRNEDGIVNENDMYHYKTSTPDYLFGLSSRFEYKNFDMAFSARGSLGNYMYNDFAAGNATYQFLYNTTYIQNLPKAVLNSEFESQQIHSDFYVQDASFLRMDNISAGYRFNKHIRLSLTVQNVFVLTKYEGIDPEVFSGIDNQIYPRPRTFVLGANLTF